MNQKSQSNNFVFWGIISLVCLVAVSMLQYFIWTAPRTIREEITLTIPEGSTAKQIAQLLKANSIIKSEYLFLLTAKLTDKEKALKPGIYTIPSKISIFNLLDKLVGSAGVIGKITFLENWTFHDYALELLKNGIDTTTFFRAAHDKDLLSQFGINADNAEGYLFPDTYFISSDMNGEFIVKMLLKRFRKVVNQDFEAKAQGLNFSLHEIVTLASIIGGEVKVREEAFIVSSVYHNRLRKGIQLQADPTIQYILPGNPRRLLFKDLKIDSPYNTYLYKGLPPGPIGNPGKLALEAAINPAKTDYLFFVSQGDGTHAFNKTIEGHLKSKTVLDSLRIVLKNQKKNKVDSLNQN